MRDIVLTAFIFGSVPFILRWPVYGVLMYVWLSVMTPHRLTWGFAYDFSFVMVVAIATFVGMFLTRSPKHLPWRPAVVALALMVLWMNLSTVFAFNMEASTADWKKIMKILLMVFVALLLVHSKKQIEWLIWVVTGSVAYFGVKGGIFTLVSGGQYRVWGPEGFIAENNALALATIMTIPLLRYIQLQTTRRWLWWALLGAMVCCGFSALGSHSRGAFVAIAAMLAFLWLKSRNKLMTACLMLLLVPFAIGFMSDRWEDRMRTIENYDQDASAMGRLNAWWMAYNLAKDRPLTGGGFQVYTPEVFARYAPNPTDIHAAHSIYFQMLGEHGFVGLLLFMLVWYFTWRDSAWIRKHVQKREEWKWAGDLASMVQVSLVGYAVGGAFLSLAYYDVPYYLMAAIVLTRVLLEREVKENPLQPASWRTQAARAGPPAIPPGKPPAAGHPAPIARNSGMQRGGAGGSRGP